MKDFEQCIEECVIGVNKEKLHSHHDFYSSVKKAAELYAEEVAKAQREACLNNEGYTPMLKPETIPYVKALITSTPLVTDNK